ncbi:MAG: DUF58 domain-containing protein [Verrucomicrobia bacterium]|nr:DUF58 domain-containing protein [Verrucomicrobiota bacterium]
MTATTARPTLFHRYLWRNYHVLSSFTFWLRRRFTWGGLLLVASIAATAALGADTNLAPAYQAFAVLVVLFIVSVIGSRFSRANVTARRELPRHGTAGVPFTYKVTLDNRSSRVQRGLGVVEKLADPRPSLVEFSTTPEPGEERRNWFDRRYAYYRWRWLVTRHVRARAEERSAPVLTPHSTTKMTLELIPTRRGVLRFEAITIACPDPFGLFRSLVDVPSPQSVLMEFISLRDYRPGDPMRRIHWRSWAKMGRPIVKEFQDEFFVRHALVLDTFAPADAETQESVFEEAVSLAASFACALDTQESLLDLLFVGPQAYCFTAGRGVAHKEQMLEVLASVNVCRERQFYSLVRLVVEQLPFVDGCICILISWDMQRQMFIRQLRERGTPVRVFVITPPGTEVKPAPGPMADEPGNFHVLEAGKLAEALAKL